MNKNEYSSGANNDVSHENPASSKHMNSSTLENIPEIKSASAGLGRSTKLLVVFGSVVIACAVAAIAVSVGLYVSRSCSTSSSKFRFFELLLISLMNGNRIEDHFVNSIKKD